MIGSLHQRPNDRHDRRRNERLTFPTICITQRSAIRTGCMLSFPICLSCAVLLFFLRLCIFPFHPPTDATRDDNSICLVYADLARRTLHVHLEHGQGVHRVDHPLRANSSHLFVTWVASIGFDFVHGPRRCVCSSFLSFYWFNFLGMALGRLVCSCGFARHTCDVRRSRERAYLHTSMSPRPGSYRSYFSIFSIGLVVTCTLLSNLGVIE